MFEKEAEEYAIENYEECMYSDVKGWENDRKAREQSFQDGAEFGYKKGLEFGIKSTEQVNDIINNKAKELLKWFVWYFREGSPNLVPYKHKVTEAEQFLKESEVK